MVNIISSWQFHILLTNSSIVSWQGLNCLGHKPRTSKSGKVLTIHFSASTSKYQYKARPPERCSRESCGARGMAVSSTEWLVMLLSARPSKPFRQARAPRSQLREGVEGTCDAEKLQATETSVLSEGQRKPMPECILTTDKLIEPSPKLNSPRPTLD